MIEIEYTLEEALAMRCFVMLSLAGRCTLLVLR